MVIITAGEADLPVIRAIVDATWPVAYGDILSSRQIDYMIRLFYSDEALVQQMHSGHHFILGVENGVAHGFAGFEHNHPERGKSKLHKLYVHPAQQHKGIGGQLLKEVIYEATNAGSDALLLNVNRYNKAVGFYRSHGFRIAWEEDIDIGEGYFMNDYVMINDLLSQNFK